MAISHINSATNSTTGATSLTVNKPTNTAENDVMIAVIAIENASDLINSVPSGWAIVGSLNQPLSTRAHRQYVYWKLAGASEGSSYQWGTSSSVEMVGIISTFRGINTASPIGNSNYQVNNTSTTSCTAPAITVQAVGNWVLHVASNMYGTTWTAPTGTPTYTERADVRSGTGTANMSASLHSAEYTSTGTTGTKVATAANADFNIGSHLELKIAPVVVTPSPITAATTKVDPTVILGSLTIAPVARAIATVTAIGAIVLGSLTISPTAITSAAQAVDPTVSISQAPITPSAITAAAATVAPTVVLGSLSIAPNAATSTAAKVDPAVVQGSITVAPGAITAASGSVNPTVVLGSLSLTPNAVSAATSKVDPTVDISTGNVAVSPLPISAVGSTVDPGVVLGSLSITPNARAIATSMNNPDVVLGSLTLSPSAWSAIARAVSPTVFLSGETPGSRKATIGADDRDFNAENAGRSSTIAETDRASEAESESRQNAATALSRNITLR